MERAGGVQQLEWSGLGVLSSSAAGAGGAENGPAWCLVPVTHGGPRDCFSFSLCCGCPWE